MYTAKKTLIEIIDPSKQSSTESNVCPYCGSLNFSEAPQEITVNPEIVALIDSPLADVNARLAEGYQVMPDKIYSKNCILVKYASGNPVLEELRKDKEQAKQLAEASIEATQ